MQRFRLGAVTDVFSPDIALAAAEMRSLGLHGAELRTMGGRHILDVERKELDAAFAVLRENSMEVVAIATPLLKCSLDEWKTQSRQAERAFDIAGLAGAKIVRVFSGTRASEPAAVFERVVDILQDLADKAGRRGLIVALENDRACNVATAQEMAGVLAAIDHSNLQLVWDPASAYISGEKPFPSGYQMLDVKRIALVHAKDCTLEGHKPVWEPLGEGDIDWQGQIDALAEDGYEGFIHLETYWTGVRDCVRNLRQMVEALAL
ncbi:MAG TPA: sugar phosphate isomerase/epimerase family protein [Bryobacteraceae bacterium]|jgi:L-ribulose-5-phosphate 3-epimerase|nr:sugar phosphate isomerase/epimerase family protein [Bryobacteraceae bacterium]